MTQMQPAVRYVSVVQGTVAVTRASKDETNVSKHVACFVQLLWM